MNNGYYTPPIYPGSAMPITGTPNQQTAPMTDIGAFPPTTIEQTYIENILRLNKGKTATFYMSFPDSIEWKDRIFKGIVEQAGRDHIIVSNPSTGEWYLLLIIYLDYVTFDEPINYIKTFD